MGKGHSSPEYLENWRNENKPHINEYNRNYVKNNPEVKEYRDNYGKEYRKTHKYKSNSTKKVRNKIFELLGKKCVKCGFSDIRILQIDHIKGNGKKQRKALKNYYRMLLKILEDLTAGSKDYQILCPNCNWIKRIENKEEK
jgi:hypothetical protein